MMRRRGLLGNTGTLVGEWLFQNNLNDTSGQGNNGTAFGGNFTNDRFSSPNSAYHFDNPNDYIAVTGVPQTANFTIDLWVKWTAANNVGILSRASWVAGNQGDYGLILFNNEVLFTINDAAYTVTSTTGNMQNNTWRHLVASFDGTEMKLVIDGTNINTLSAPVALDQNYTEIHFGQYFRDDSNFSMTGDLDEIKIYDGLI